MIKKYLKIELQFIGFALKFMLQYRVNTLMQSIFFPAWQIAMYGVVWIMFQQTQQIAGWSYQEAMVLFFVYHILSSVSYFLYFEGGSRWLMWIGVRTGAMDMVLTKPLNSLFYTMFARPNISPIISLIVMSCLFAYHLLTYPLIGNVGDVVMFLVMLTISQVIVFFITVLYSSAAFFSSQSQQLAEILDKSAEFAQYPLEVFPNSIQAIFLTVLPVGFSGYLATIFLLGRGSVGYVIFSLSSLIITGLLTKWAWSFGLKHYSSASS